MKTPTQIFLAFALALTSFAASAGVITSLTWSSGVASVALEPIPITDFSGNDNVVGDSPNQIFVYQKDYFAIGPVDIEFTVEDRGEGTTEYRITEGVQNSTGIDWGSYHIELGFGVGASFVKSTLGDGLDFDAPDFDSPVSFDPAGPPGTFFTTISYPSEDDLLAEDGSHPAGAYAGDYIFHIDVPDGISSFTLRQSPIAAAGAVPVPAAAWLFASALGLLGYLRRK